MRRKLLVTTIWMFSFAAMVMAADLTGRWMGTITPPGGQEERFLLILKQDGAMLTGTAGASDSDRHPITKAAIQGDRLTFEVATPEATLAFDLKVNGIELSGRLDVKKGDQVLNAAQVSVKR